MAVFPSVPCTHLAVSQAVTGVAGGDREELMLREGEQTKAPAAGSSKGRKRKAATAAADAAGGHQEGAGEGGDAQQQQQESHDGGVRSSSGKRQRGQTAGGRGRAGRDSKGGRGRGRGRQQGFDKSGSDDTVVEDCGAASGLPAAAQQGPGNRLDQKRQQQQQQQQESLDQGNAASRGPEHPARRQPSRGRRAVVVLPLPEDA